jgi:hypothetical protein
MSRRPRPPRSFVVPLKAGALLLMAAFSCPMPRVAFGVPPDRWRRWPLFEIGPNAVEQVDGAGGHRFRIGWISDVPVNEALLSSPRLSSALKARCRTSRAIILGYVP